MTEPLTCPGNRGWDDILNRLAADLRAAGYQGPVDVKEKYGQLSIEVGPAPVEIHRLTEAAEAESGQTCQVCGLPGTPQTRDGWAVTRCPAC